MQDQEVKMQELSGNLVSKEVYCHVGGLVEMLNEATSDQFLFDNFNPEPTDEQVKEYMESEGVDDFDEAYDSLRDSFEPMEYWAVSDWLGDKLTAKGEVVAEIGLTTIWARQTSGQAILLDSVIKEITKESNYGGVK